MALSKSLATSAATNTRSNSPFLDKQHVYESNGHEQTANEIEGQFASDPSWVGGNAHNTGTGIKCRGSDCRGYVFVDKNFD